MRVVAGSARGVPLHVPREGVRPTMDLVKGAIFSSLGERIIGARVLDLFAGAGALGIEALSRGCASAVFIDNNAQAVQAIRRNLEKTRLEGAVHQLDVFSFLDRLTQPGGYDVIFADPPYSKKPGARDFGVELLAAPSLRRAAAADAIFVLEKLPGTPLPRSAAWELLRQKKYGSTEVALFRCIDEPKTDPASP